MAAARADEGLGRGLAQVPRNVLHEGLLQRRDAAVQRVEQRHAHRGDVVLREQRPDPGGLRGGGREVRALVERRHLTARG